MTKQPLKTIPLEQFAADLRIVAAELADTGVRELLIRSMRLAKTLAADCKAAGAAAFVPLSAIPVRPPAEDGEAALLLYVMELAGVVVDAQRVVRRDLEAVTR